MLLGGVGVTLATSRLQPSPTLPDVGCYLDFIEGPLVEETGGLAIIWPDGHHQAVVFPGDWTLRNEGGQIAVYDRTGHFTVRAGTNVYLPGGTAPDGLWESCSGARELP